MNKSISKNLKKINFQNQTVSNKNETTFICKYKYTLTSKLEPNQYIRDKSCPEILITGKKKYCNITLYGNISDLSHYLNIDNNKNYNYKEPITKEISSYNKITYIIEDKSKETRWWRNPDHTFIYKGNQLQTTINPDGKIIMVTNVSTNYVDISMYKELQKILIGKFVGDITDKKMFSMLISICRKESIDKLNNTVIETNDVYLNKKENQIFQHSNYRNTECFYKLIPRDNEDMFKYDSIEKEEFDNQKFISFIDKA